MSDPIQSIPEESAVEKHIEAFKEKDPPKHIPPVNNLAGDKELATTFLEWTRKQFEHFKSQQERVKFVQVDGVMDKADRMLRVALNRDTTSKQYQPTLSDVASTMFYRQHRALMSSMNSIFLDDKDLPAEYEPEINTTVYSVEDGKWLAEKRNMLALHTWDEDKRREKTKDATFTLLKYSNIIVSDEWNRCVEMRKIKVAGYYDGDGLPQPYDPKAPPAEMFDAYGNILPEVVDAKGTPTHFVFLDREVVTADQPTLMIHDIKDCFFDATLDDETLWRCFVKVGQLPYEQLVAKESQGEIQNASKIKPTHLYTQEIESTKNDRKENADDGAICGPTGLVNVFHVWGVVPIEERKKNGVPNGKGKWDADKVVSSMFWGFYAGNIESGDCVALKIVKNPYMHGKHPYKMIHLLRDDKGAFHGAMSQLIEPLYWQDVTNINMAFDNIMERNRAPWTADGPVHTRNMGFAPDKLIRIGKGTNLVRVVVPDTTQLTMASHDRIELDANDTTGANKAVQAQALGGRASATEAKQIMDQALLPIDDLASYVGDQWFNWLLEMDASLWDQFGDPSRVVMVTSDNQIVEVKPSHIWGPVKTRVTAVTRFRNNAIRRKQINAFISGALPMASNVMGQQGQREFWRDAFKLFGFDRALDFVPDFGDYDAKSRAINAAHQLLSGQWVEPQQNENHNAWLAVMLPMAREYGMLPDADRNDEGLKLLQQHVEVRKGMLNSSSAMPQAGGANAAEGAAPALGGSGMEAGGMMAAEEGSVANM